MKPVVPTEPELAVMRSIARAGFGYDAAKRICSQAGWEISADEPDLGFVQYWVDFAGKRGNRRLFAVCFGKSKKEPFAFVPLYCFGYGAGDPAELERAPFDRAYSHIVDGLSAVLGPPYRVGSYSYAHREGWPYSFAWWRLTDASLALVQDEYDIQSGMDVSLWVLPPREKVKLPLHE